jgi:hypothetical protein
VIEGWRELDLADGEIDGLIASENTDLLRRFRNCVFHFQPEYDDGRFLGFLDHADELVEWARSLHNAFARWFQDWATEKFGFGPRDIAAWMKAEKEAAEGPEAAENAKSCEPEGPQDLTGRLSHGR